MASFKCAVGRENSFGLQVSHNQINNSWVAHVSSLRRWQASQSAPGKQKNLGLFQGCGGGFPGACQGCKVGSSKAAIKRARKSAVHPRKDNAVPRPSIPAEAITVSRCLSPCCSQPPCSRDVAPRSQG